MKKILFSFLVLQLISALNLYSQQSGWVWQNPLPQGNPVISLNVFDANTAIFLNSYNILKTTDGGAGWNQLSTGFYPYNTSISAVNENLIFMLVDSTVLIKSTDKGNTWKYVCDKKEIENSDIYFLNSKTGFALNKKTINYWYSMAIRRTSDGGKNWNLTVSDDSIMTKKLFFINEQTGFAACVRYFPNLSYKTKIYKTINSGLTWDSLKNDLLISPAEIYFINENTGFLTGNIYNSSYKIYRTTNGGINWTALTGLSGAAVTKIKFFDELNGIMLSNDKIYITANGGLNWQNRYILLNGYVKNMNLMGFINTNTGYVSGGSEILKTTNAGVNWSKITGDNVFNPNGYHHIWDIRFANEYTGFAAGDNGKILRTTNGGTNWELKQLAQQLNFEAIAYADNTWYLSEWYYGKVLKSTNTGLSWDTTYTNVYGITELQFINANTGFGVCKYLSFIKTTDGGANWIATQPFGSQNWALHFIDENTGFAGGMRVYKTTNGGTSWDSVTFGYNLHYYAESINFINNSTGFIAGNSVILKTTNTGTNWERVLSLNYGYFYDIQFVSNQTGYAITQGGFYKSTDEGNSWKQHNTCIVLYSNYISMNFTDTRNGWIATGDGIIIRTTNGGESVFHQSPYEQIPTSFYLFQNYPNPFNPITTIRYGLPNKAFIKLKIYDILGRLVKELYNGEQEAGNHSLIFDGSVYASGVYFCTLETPEFTQSQKMVLLK